MKKITVIIIVLIFFSGGLNAQEAQEEKPEVRGKKSIVLAYGLSVGVPVLMVGGGYIITSSQAGRPNEDIGFFLIGLGAGVAPSIGHFYAGQSGRGCLFLSLEILSATLFYAALRQGNPDAAIALGVSTGVLYGTTTIVSWTLIPSSISRYNKKLQMKPEIDVKEGRYGLGITFRF